MTTEESCHCDYSYICPMHQRQITAELEQDNNRKRAEHVDARLDWIIQSIKKLATHLNVTLPEDP